MSAMGAMGGARSTRGVGVSGVFVQDLLDLLLDLLHVDDVGLFGLVV